MLGKLFGLFGIGHHEKKINSQQARYEAGTLHSEAELLDVDTPELDEIYQQGYDDAIDDLNFDDIKSEYTDDAIIEELEHDEEIW